MSNRQVKNGIVALMGGLLLGLSVGCESAGRVPPSPEPQPRQEPPIVYPLGVPYDPNYEYTWDVGHGVLYRQNKETCEWERYNSNTGQWEPSGPPPGLGQVVPVPLVPTETQLAESSAAPEQPELLAATGCGGALLRSTIDYGTTPDVNGMVSPLVWVTTFQALSTSELTADDTLDFFMAVNTMWMLATDYDPNLLAAIGPENITYHPLDPPQPNVAVLKLNDISIRNLALFIHGTGFAGIDSKTPYGKWTLRYDPQRNVVTIKWKNSLVDEISLD